MKDPSHYYLKTKSKNVRSCLIMLLSKAMWSKNGTMEEFMNTKEYELSCLLSAIMEIGHNASLLQDDILDRADVRRGQTSAHLKYGVTNAFFASQFLVARSSGYLSRLDTPHLS